MEFKEYPKIARLSRNMIITEKIDGTNACIGISENGELFAGSRNRWLSDKIDNHGFFKWVLSNKNELMKLGVGYHYGEWWGNGIQRGYGLKQGDKRFSLFNTTKWSDTTIRPTCCSVVPELYKGLFDTRIIDNCLYSLQLMGSKAAPEYLYPEGVVIYHEAQGTLFKKTIIKDECHKTNQ
ncbi:MAG: RNA editing ligase [Podoviridae sp. cty5g4]|nr:MAG: RNA editing ligase [Podoviridae sp. cty5g4]